MITSVGEALEGFKDKLRQFAEKRRGNPRMDEGSEDAYRERAAFHAMANLLKLTRREMLHLERECGFSDLVGVSINYSP